MIQELSDRLSKAIEQKRLKDKLEKDLRAVEGELREKSSRFASLGSQLDQEKIDVEKLEQIGLTYLFYSVLGSREEQLEKQRQELLSAQVSYQQTRKQVEYLEQERDRLAREVERLAGAESGYEAALSEKERFLQQSDQNVSRELLAFSEELANLHSELKEIEEAILAGESVLPDLDQAISSLGSAEDWGLWDMFGGGLISGMVKHSHIDEAHDNVNRAQEKIRHFKRELADVQRETDIQINIGGLATFADFFLDGLIADWIIQSKIEDSLAQVNHAKNTIVQAIRNLEMLREDSQAKINDRAEKRALLIERT